MGNLLLLKVRTWIPAVDHRVMVSVSLMQYFVSRFFNVILCNIYVYAYLYFF